MLQEGEELLWLREGHTLELALGGGRAEAGVGTEAGWC